SSSAWSDQLRSSVTLCSAKNSNGVVLLVISQAVALAPFSQNSKVRGLAGLAQEQLTHMNPSGLFCLSRISLPRIASSSCVRILATALSEPQPPAGASLFTTFAFCRMAFPSSQARTQNR